MIQSYAVMMRYSRTSDRTRVQGDSKERHAHRSLVPHVWQLRDSLTAYDPVYVALAEALDAPLLTCDAKLAGARGHQAKIELVAN